MSGVLYKSDIEIQEGKSDWHHLKVKTLIGDFYFEQHEENDFEEQVNRCCQLNGIEFSGV